MSPSLLYPSLCYPSMCETAVILFLGPGISPGLLPDSQFPANRGLFENYIWFSGNSIAAYATKMWFKSFLQKYHENENLPNRSAYSRSQGSEPNSFNVNTDRERLHRFILNHNITQFPPVRRLFSFSLSWQKARN